MTVLVEETRDLDACLALRRVVFIEEQSVPEAIEVDGEDTKARHVLAHLDGTAVGTARLLSYGTTAKIGRVCVLKHHRGQGIGAAIMKACHHVAADMGARRVILGAQADAIGFYEQLGYRAYGDVFMDAGIAHRMMERSVS